MLYNFAPLFVLFLVTTIPAIVLINPISGENVNVTVKLSNGYIRGRESLTTTNKTYYVFQKIPYAEPPIEELRFQPPVKKKEWDGILDTQKMDVMCFQVTLDSDMESEDCLYLNVYTPKLPNQSGDLPVMFYIFGGGFIEGNCLDNVYGPEFLIDRDVIVVTINYRVGPFGFLSTQDQVMPGNNGLKDQHMALKWTYENIGKFGGDQSKITVFGQSAGAASATYQMLYQKSQEKLFRAVILESGSCLCPWAYQRKAREIAFKTASYLDEDIGKSDDSRRLFDFLRSISAKELDEASFNLSQTENPQNRQINQGFFYAPVIEVEHNESFLTEKMYVKLKEGRFIKVPTLMGINSEENVFHAYLPEWLTQTMDQYDKNLDWLVPGSLQIGNIENITKIGEQIRDIYTGGAPLSLNHAPAVRFYSDNSFNRPIIRHAELLSRHTDVYFYKFSYDGDLGNFPFAIEGAENVTHGEENKYIWRMFDDNYDNSDLTKFSSEDRITQNRIQKIWTDFAKDLNPTPTRTNLIEYIQWPKVSPKDRDNFPYVDILKHLIVRRGPKKDTYAKWKTIFESVEYEDFDTY